ncbi:GNAT family N-acetyltransferase [Metabacillus idriensis]|uniref:GNAT family N-acetyltransferase n=1 Tax=Metabacillus idriensis TaxID=324768 RepID=A0A6I2MFL2_9BACI|nr:GNAT family N-acetyltransferase [Metabacillus idriensis]MCM3595975.1 GNAT family N-acetyltransferase [Metabacillus idriensis]MRX57065.1 GNAT family N-acetyltransferase [Metabacillus idriensis]OHR69818.1 acetyltransferase [Bacillus sp. HMSC76G11]
MTVHLVKATESDAAAILDGQVRAFTPLLEKYMDVETNPANETLEKILARINEPNGGFYKIIFEETLAGAIRVYSKSEATKYWISPIFIFPEFQGCGIAQKAMISAETLFPQASSFELATILEEEGNCYLYKKLGYKETGVMKKLNDRTTLIYFRKGF